MHSVILERRDEQWGMNVAPPLTAWSYGECIDMCARLPVLTPCSSEMAGATWRTLVRLCVSSRWWRSVLPYVQCLASGMAACSPVRAQVALGVGLLLAFHLYMAATGQTTVEWHHWTMPRASEGPTRPRRSAWRRITANLSAFFLPASTTLCRCAPLCADMLLELPTHATTQPRSRSRLLALIFAIPASYGDCDDLCAQPP
jgi:hypothetical protein